MKGLSALQVCMPATCICILAFLLHVLCLCSALRGYIWGGAGTIGAIRGTRCMLHELLIWGILWGRLCACVGVLF